MLVKNFIPSLQKLVTVVSAVPRLEKYIQDICTLCSRTLEQQNDEATQISAGEVLSMIEKWTIESDELQSYKEIEKIMYC